MAAMAHVFLLSILSILSIMLLPFMASASVKQFPPANAAQVEGFRMEMIRRDSELPRSEQIRKSIKRSYLRAKLLSSRLSSPASSSKTLLPSASDPTDGLGDLALADAGGDFTIKVLIGTPSQAFFLVMDSASELVWVQCSSYYEYWLETILSSTYQTLNCTDRLCRYLTKKRCSNHSSTCKYGYDYRYGARTTGELATENFGIHTSHGIFHFSKFVFGCAGRGGGYDSYGFQPDIDGIIGFGRGRLSFPSQLSSILNNKYSYCLQVYTNVSLMFFGSEAEIQQPGIQTTPVLTNASNPAYYYLNVTGIKVGGSNIRIPYHAFENSGGTILDSGSTLTNFPASLHKIIRKEFIRKIPLRALDGSGIGLDFCYNISSAPNITFPALVLEFENAVMKPPQDNYFFAPDPDRLPWIVCSALVPSDGDLNIIGNLMQQNYKILYDDGASKISFARAQCDKL